MSQPDPAPQAAFPPAWVRDKYDHWNLKFGAEMDFPDGRRFGPVHAWIGPRPAYCDRGHWQFNVDGIPSLDHADSFPRYYMDLDVAKREAEAWLRWRIFKQRS